MHHKSAPQKVLNSEMNFHDVKTSVQTLAQLKTLKPGSLPGALIIFTALSRAKSRQCLAVLPEDIRGRVKNQIERLGDTPEAGSINVFGGISAQDPDVVLAVMPEDVSTFSLLGFCRKVSKSTVSEHLKNLSIVFDGVKDEESLADCFGSALAARTFQLPLIGKRTEKAKSFQLKDVRFFGSKGAEKSFWLGWHKGNGSNIVRFLGMLPPNVLDTEEYGKRIQKICKEFGFQFKFYSNKELKKMGAGAFTAVDQGDPESHGGIYELTYSPRGAKGKSHVALVGKGLCFDTGGYDVKTGGWMLNMKGDMQGSAVALSTMMTAAHLKLPIKLKTFLGVTANHLSPKAYTCDEVVVALNGVAIEVINTDAEGRMVLADTLCLADRSKPMMIVDFATLTGSAVRSLGNAYAAGFTNQDKLHGPIVNCGKESGERVWTFPMDSDYGDALKSPIADTIQCAKSGAPDHILAAIFLKKFVEDKTPWVHIDLAAAEKEGGLAHIDGFYTGFGVRWAIEFIRHHFKV